MKWVLVLEIDAPDQNAYQAVATAAVQAVGAAGARAGLDKSDMRAYVAIDEPAARILSVFTSTQEGD